MIDRLLTRVMRQAVKAALIALTIIAPAREALSATIRVHEPDGEGRVFVDVVGPINEEDFKTFKEKTDQIYPIGAGHPNKQVIVTLISYGGSAKAGLQISDWIRKRGMSTFVPGDRTCTSACALIWLAGRPRMVGDNPYIGFHAIFNPKTRQETGTGNAVVGAYLRDLGLGYDAIAFMTRAGPTSVEWLTPDRAKEFRVAWAMLQSPRAIPIPPQPKLQPSLHLAPPPQVPWSKSAPQQALQQPAPAPPASSKPVCLTPAGTPEPCEARLRQPAPAPKGAQERIEPRQLLLAFLAQKAVLYEEDPADPNGKSFFGWVIWRTETITPGPGQPPELAIRADIEVPERKLAVTWSLQRNTDKGMPATHVVKIIFTVPPDSSGGISNVPGILMKQALQTTGVPLAGLSAKVTPSFYRIGLSNVEADKDRNIQLLKERSWFSIPVVYNNNRRAILAIEKGTPGESAFADAFKAWELPVTTSPEPVPQQAPPTARRTTSLQDDMGRFVSKVLGSTELLWKQIFAQDGRMYRAPVLVLYPDVTHADCGGVAQSAMEPFYCSVDQKVYLDTSFRGCDVGSKPCQFAQAYVIAHVVGHHVQNLLGILPKAQQAQRAAGSRAGANHIQVQVELQADCLAGVWANHENQYLRSQGKPPFIEPGDVEAALRTAAAIGDETLQRKAQGYVVPDSFTHGSTEQRQRWFNAGLQSGKVGSCNTFAAAQL
jgi:uncharacterized protein